MDRTEVHMFEIPTNPHLISSRSVAYRIRFPLLGQKNFLLNTGSTETYKFLFIPGIKKRRTVDTDAQELKERRHDLRRQREELR
jgi:hypothetical protein